MRSFVLFVLFVLAVVLLISTFIPAHHTRTAGTINIAHTVESSVHHIVFSQGEENRQCTSTAVGAHTLLSAAHCVLGTGVLSVDDNDRNIVAMTYDENDHVLIGVDGDTFAAYLPITLSEPTVSTHVRMLGWPGASKDAVYRDGTLLAVEHGEDGDYLWRWQLPVFAGDSGSALLTDDDKIISVLSLGNTSAQAVSFPFRFTKDQLRDIK